MGVGCAWGSKYVTNTQYKFGPCKYVAYVLIGVNRHVSIFPPTHTFSSTIPFAWEAPPNGLAFSAVPRCFFL